MIIVALSYIVVVLCIFLAKTSNILRSIIFISAINVIDALLFLSMGATQVAITQASITAITTFVFLLSLRFRGGK